MALCPNHTTSTPLGHATYIPGWVREALHGRRMPQRHALLQLAISGWQALYDTFAAAYSSQVDDCPF